jgi:methyl-accepting chemotaxis protein
MGETAVFVNRSIETVADIAKESSSTTGEVSNSVQAIHDQVQEMENSSVLMKEISTRISQNVARFKYRSEEKIES